MVVDGFMIGVLRGGPNAFLTDWTFDPYLNATYYTWLQMWNDTWSNGARSTASRRRSARRWRTASRVSVVPSLGARPAHGGRRRPIRSPRTREWPRPAAAAPAAGDASMPVRGRTGMSG